jgi:hypothetical protein
VGLPRTVAWHDELDRPHQVYHADPIAGLIAWLKANQRASGRWFTRSLKKDSRHFITHAGTAFAVMALVSREPDE